MCFTVMADKKRRKTGQTLNERFKISKKIGHGAFGAIYLASDLQTGKMVAVKFESLRYPLIQLDVEYRFYSLIQNEPGFVKALAYDRYESEMYLAIELLNKNLMELFKMCDQKFSIKTTVYIAIQLITRLATIHEREFIYRDLKPENFMVGFPGKPNEKIIHVVDFGLVKRYINPLTKQHIPCRQGIPLTGTTRYMSCNAHFNQELSRRDDLESLAYMLLLFLKGRLPWSGIIQNAAHYTSYDQLRIGSMKQSLSPAKLFEGFPDEFAFFLQYARDLEFTAQPNYDMLRSKFRSVFERLQLTDDNAYDWDSLLLAENLREPNDISSKAIKDEEEAAINKTQ